jgi:hypothetical protein
VVVGAEVQLRV